jgi:uroporphyrinogen-III synthase
MIRSVLVTRPHPVADDFADKLKRDGMAAYVAPLMQYADLSADLSAATTADAIIFTSAQGANVFARNSTFRDAPVFAVGEATAQAARRNGFTRVYTAAGDGRDLAALIISRKTSLALSTLFHASGEDIAEDLGKLLEPEGMTVIRVAAYRAEIIDSFSDGIIDALTSGRITSVTLFSSRTAEAFARIMDHERLTPAIGKLEIVCLSQRIAEEIRRHKFKSIRVARTPHVQSMLEILREKDYKRPAGAVMLADPVIAAYGGLRPLASRLGITASTVQGWKERGVVPEARLREVMDALAEDGIGHDGFWKEGRKYMQDGGTPKTYIDPQGRERRRGPDRRQTPPVFDENGNVVSPNYTGPDRRSGVDRRDRIAQKEIRIRNEKWRFFNRTIISTAFLTCGFLYAATFLLAPEYLSLSQDAKRVAEMDAQMKAMDARLKQLQSQTTASAPIGASISHGIEELSNAAGGVANTIGSTVGNVAGVAGHALSSGDTGSNIRQLLQVLSNLSYVASTPEGRAQLAASLPKIKTIMKSATSAGKVNTAVDDLRKQDPAMKTVLGHVETNDLAAAALLLTLNEFRSDINTGRAFEDDLLIIQKFAGDDPEMQKSLRRLAPYAKTGVLSRARLQKELKATAGDIVMAKLKGEDATVQDKVMQRFAKLVKIRKVGDISGDTPDAVVARAQLLLDKGDVRGAMTELNKLEGPEAQAAAPFMNQAAGSLLAEDSSALLMQMIMGKLSTSGGLSLENFFSGFSGPAGNGGSIYLSPSMQGGQ